MNRGIGNAAITVNVPITEDTDHVSDVLGEIARGMRGERRFADMMRSDLQLWGVDKVDAGVVTIVGQIVCTDSGRWAVQREFNRRMNIRFREAGIQASPRRFRRFTTISRRSRPSPCASRCVVGPRRRPTRSLESPPPAALGNTS